MKKISFILFILIILTNICKSQHFPLLEKNMSSNDNDVIMLTSIFTLVNTYETANNFTKLCCTDKPKQNAVVGLMTGVAQIVISTTFRDDKPSETNSNLKTFKTFNFAMGSLTILSSVIRLAWKQPQKDKALSWNMYYIPMKNNNSIIGLRIAKKINL